MKPGATTRAETLTAGYTRYTVRRALEMIEHDAINREEEASYHASRAGRAESPGIKKTHQRISSGLRRTAALLRGIADALRKGAGR